MQSQNTAPYARRIRRWRMEEVSTALKKIKKGKAAGPMGFTVMYGKFSVIMVCHGYGQCKKDVQCMETEHQCSYSQEERRYSSVATTETSKSFLTL